MGSHIKIFVTIGRRRCWFEVSMWVEELLLYLKSCFLSWHNQKWNIACHSVICDIYVENSAIKSCAWIVACKTLSLGNTSLGLRIILDIDKVKCNYDQKKILIMVAC